jgi:hypothetical protein
MTASLMLLKEKHAEYIGRAEAATTFLVRAVQELNGDVGPLFPCSRFVLFMSPCNPYERRAIAPRNDENEEPQVLPSSFTAQIAVVTAYKDNAGKLRRRNTVAVWTSKDVLSLTSDRFTTLSARIVTKITTDADLLANLTLSDSANFGYCTDRMTPDASREGIPNSYPYAMNQPLPAQDERSVLQD